MSPTETTINHPTGGITLLPPGQEEVLTPLADPLVAVVQLEVLRQARLLPQAG